MGVTIATMLCPIWQEEQFRDIGDPEGKVTGVKGPRLNFTRWMSWQICNAHWQPIWTKRKIALENWGIDEGLHDPTSEQKMAQLGEEFFAARLSRCCISMTVRVC